MGILLECIECGIIYIVNIAVVIIMEILIKKTKIRNVHIIKNIFILVTCMLVYFLGIGYTYSSKYMIIENSVLIGMCMAQYCDMFDTRIMIEIALYNLIATVLITAAILDLDWLIMTWLIVELYILIMLACEMLLTTFNLERLEKKCIELLICIIISGIVVNVSCKTMNNNVCNSLLRLTIIIYAGLELMVYNIYKSVTDIEEKYSSIQYANEHYEVERIQTMYNESRKLKHDLQHFMTMISGYIDDKKYDETKRLINGTMKNRLEEYSYLRYCDNSLMNYILNDKSNRCKMYNIEFKCMVVGHVKYIDEVDMAILLGNVIDNAIEAAQKAEDKYVNVEIQIRGSIIINVENSIKDTFLGRNNPFLTSKTDLHNHGIGTKSIRSIVTKYYGEITYTENKGNVNCQIILLTDRIRE